MPACICTSSLSISIEMTAAANQVLVSQLRAETWRGGWPGGSESMDWPSVSVIADFGDSLSQGSWAHRGLPSGHSIQCS